MTIVIDANVRMRQYSRVTAELWHQNEIGGEGNVYYFLLWSCAQLMDGKCLNMMTRKPPSLGSLPCQLILLRNYSTFLVCWLHYS